MQTQVLALFALLAVHGSPQDKPDERTRLLRAIPGDALVVLTTAEFDLLREGLERNAWWKLFQDESMQGFWSRFVRAKAAADASGEFWGNVEDESESPEPAPEPSTAEFEAGLAKFTGFMAAVHGPVAGFYARDEQQVQRAGFLVQPGEKRGAFEEWIDPFLDQAFEHAATSTATYDGVELRVYDESKPAEDEDEQGGADKVALSVYVECDGMCALLGADTREAAIALAHGVIDRYRGKDAANGMAGSARLEAARAAASRASGVEVFADLGRLIEIGMREDPPDEQGLKAVTALGLDRMGWARWACAVGEGERLDVELALELPEGGGLTRLLGCLRPCAPQVLRLAPRDAVGLGAVGLDVPALWKSIFEFAAAMDADGAEQAQAQIQAAGQALGGIDIEADLIEQITGDAIQFTVTVPEDEWNAAVGAALEALPDESRAALEHLPRLGSANVIELEDASKIEDVVESLLDATGAGAGLDYEEFQGETINVLELGGDAKLAWVFMEHRLIVSQFPSALRAALVQIAKPDAGSLADNPRFGPHLAGHADAALLFAAGTPESLNAVGATMGMMSGLLGSLPGSAGVDPQAFTALWPKPAVIERYFHGTLAWSITRRERVLSFDLSAR